MPFWRSMSANASCANKGSLPAISTQQPFIQAQGSSAVRNGNLLTLTLNYLVKPAFSGPRGIWAAVQTLTAQTSPWKPLGTWLAPP